MQQFYFDKLEKLVWIWSFCDLVANNIATKTPSITKKKN